MCVVGYNDGWNEFLSKESLSCLKVSLAILWYSALLSNGGCSSPADSCNRVIISLLSDWHRDWKIVRDDAVRGRQQSLGRFVWSTDTFILCDFQKQILGFSSAHENRWHKIITWRHLLWVRACTAEVDVDLKRLKCPITGLQWTLRTGRSPPNVARLMCFHAPLGSFTNLLEPLSSRLLMT